jgi:hypothetical protein
MKWVLLISLAMLICISCCFLFSCGSSDEEEEDQETDDDDANEEEDPCEYADGDAKAACGGYYHEKYVKPYDMTVEQWNNYWCSEACGHNDIFIPSGCDRCYCCDE